MPFFRSYQKVVYCQSIIAFNRFFHGQLYGTECHKPTHPRTMTQNGIFLAKKAIFQDSSIISKVLFYAFPILGPGVSDLTGTQINGQHRNS